MMRLLVVLVLIIGISGQLHAQIVPVYEGSNGIREKVLAVCMQCHSTTVTGAARNGAPTIVNFDTYADAALWADLVIMRAAIEASMPPQGVQPLSQEQRSALIAWQAAGFPDKSAPVQDTQAPTTPAGLTATPVNMSEIDLAWSASTDNVAVTVYRVNRGGNLIASLGNVTSYGDKGLSPSTPYSYGVMACDAAGNCSVLSTSATATTQQQPDCLFNWAETSFPDFFAPRAQSSSAGSYYYRHYSQSSAYLAINSDRLLYLGPLSSDTVLDLGDVATWYGRSGCN